MANTAIEREEKALEDARSVLGRAQKAYEERLVQIAQSVSEAKADLAAIEAYRAKNPAPTK